jgi:Heparan-alpha-glucosaminide N-acetyltransferase, catalytic
MRAVARAARPVAGRALLRTGEAGRVVGLDVARCLALLGMMATHLLVPVMPDGRLAWPQALAGGRASALFALLAGAALGLVTGGVRPHQGRRWQGDAAGLLARAVAIAALGLVLGSLHTRVAVILTYYGLLFAMALPFARLRPRSLFLWAGAWGVAAPLLSQLMRSSIAPTGAAVPTLPSLAHPASLALDVLLTGYYPALTWLPYLLTGLAVSRLDLRRPDVLGRLAVAGAGLAVVAWGLSRTITSSGSVRDALTSTWPGPEVSWVQLDQLLAHGLHGTTPTGSWWWLAVVAPHSGTTLDLAQTTGSALAVVGICCLLTRFGPRAWAVAFGAGAMTLSLYTVHVVMLTPWAWPDEAPQRYSTQVAMVVALGAAFALAHLRGPLESLVRAVSQLAVRLVPPGQPPDSAVTSPGSEATGA